MMERCLRRHPTTTEVKGSFLSHANYLRALATLAGYPTFPQARPARALAAQRDLVLASPSYGDAPQGPPPKPDGRPRHLAKRRVQRGAANWRPQVRENATPADVPVLRLDVRRGQSVEDLVAACLAYLLPSGDPESVAAARGEDDG